MESIYPRETKMKEKRRDTAPVLWLCLVLATALVIAFLLPVSPNDYWWYLRVGQDTLAGGVVPQVDAFTSTRAGQEVVYHSWGAAVLFFFIYNTGGLTLTVLMRGILVAISYGLAWLTARRLESGRLGAALVILLAVLATSNNWELRPQLLAYPLFALALYLVYRWQEGRVKSIYWLPLLSLIWVNLHGSFVMLVLLTGAAGVISMLDPGRLGGEKRSTILVAGVGVVAASFINPRGWGAWTYVVDSLTLPSNQLFSAEWMPPINDHWQMNLFFLWLMLFPLLVAFSPRRVSPLEWTWFLGFGLLALWGERYVIWFVLVLTVLTGAMLADWEKKLLEKSKKGSPLLNGILGIVFLLLPLMLLPGVREAWWEDAPPATENTPLAATEWLREHPELPGPLWSEIGFSSYLEFTLPERPTWIDTRFEVFTVEQWQAYRDISVGKYNWENLLEESGAGTLMVSTQTQGNLLVALDTSTAWCERYRDETAVIFALCEEGR